MALPDRNNPYSFDEYIAWREQVDFWLDDPFMRKTVKLYAKDTWPIVDAEIRKISDKLSHRWRHLLDIAAKPENAMYL